MKEIELTQGQIAIVDDEDFEYLSQWKWYAEKSNHSYRARRNTYPRGRKYPVGILMHNIIMKTPLGFECDHINHNTLDNRKINLRNVTHLQNMYNQVSPSKNKLFKGVTKSTKTRNYEAHIQGKHIGTFPSPELAAIAYDKRAIELFGDFAKLNFPPNGNA